MDDDMEWKVLTPERLERYQQIAKDTKKEFHYSKDQGVWFWTDRGEALPTDPQPCPQFWDALCDAVEPYVPDSEN